MSIEEFNKQQWTPSLVAKYHKNGNEYPIMGVDFQEQLIGLDGVVQGSNDLTWVRCESITITRDLDQELPIKEEA
jgi:hypothetical protein